jgi:hypothetical protein
MDINLDPVQQLAWDSKFCVAVLGNDHGDYLLCDLDREGFPLDQGQLLRARTQNFYFAGVMGTIHGDLAIRAEFGCLPIMLKAIPDFGVWLKGKLADHDSGRAKDVAELNRLYQLPDERQES